MNTEYLIIGQGLCGTWLSYYLHKAGKSVYVVDDHKNNSPSRVAAGIINPVTGRRLMKSWMIDQVLPFAGEAYAEIGAVMGHKFCFQKNIIDFFPSPFMRESFLIRKDEDDTFLRIHDNEECFEEYFNYDFGCGEITQSMVVHLQGFLEAWRAFLRNKNLVGEGCISSDSIRISDHLVNIGDIRAEKLIFCDGAAMSSNPFFRNLPFSFNKGEALIIQCGNRLPDHLFKKGLLLAPLADENFYWVGSNYIWEFEDEHPTDKFREQTEAYLKSWLKIPFKVVDHKAGIRPATIERRPFVGMHPAQKNIGTLNGMGTKGCSLAPFFASRFVDLLIHGRPIIEEASIDRYSGALMRSE